MINLMKSTFYNEKETKEKLCEFIKNSERLSMGPHCEKFEEEFSKYQGRKYSVLFNSGSSANLALIQSLLNLKILKKNDNVGFSALTWATNTMPLIQLGLTPLPIDVSLDNLNITSEKLSEHIEDIKVLFLTNLLGFSGDISKVKEMCNKNKVVLIEDNCESLGSIVEGTKLGNFGLASTFSFYVGHHISTIEGGMVCTDNKELYNMLLMVRSHGWSRNVDYENKEKLKIKNEIENFYDGYTFYHLGYNLRPTEITGFLGLEQLKYVDDICKLRGINFNKYLSSFKESKEIVHLDLSHMEFISNFVYPLIFHDKKLRDKAIARFSKVVEIRPIVGGSIVKQPFYEGKKYLCPNAEKIHECGFYIPNNPELTEKEIDIICDLLK